MRVQATKSSSGVEVTTDGAGVVGHAGAALLRELADRLELTSMLGWRVPAASDAIAMRTRRCCGTWRSCWPMVGLPFRPGGAARPARAVGAGGLHPDRLAGRGAPGPGPDGLARLRLAHARGRGWAAGGDPQVELLVIDADATLVVSHTDAKQGAAGTSKHTFGFAPLLPPWTAGLRPGRRWLACCGRATPPGRRR